MKISSLKFESDLYLDVGLCGVPGIRLLPVGVLQQSSVPVLADSSGIDGQCSVNSHWGYPLQVRGFCVARRSDTMQQDVSDLAVQTVGRFHEIFEDNNSIVPISAMDLS